MTSSRRLRVKDKKTQVLRKNITTDKPVSESIKALEAVQEMIYLGSRVDRQ